MKIINIGDNARYRCMCVCVCVIVRIICIADGGAATFNKFYCIMFKERLSNELRLFIYYVLGNYLCKH